MLWAASKRRVRAKGWVCGVYLACTACSPASKASATAQVPYGGAFHQELLFIGTAEGASSCRLQISCQVPSCSRHVPTRRRPPSPTSYGSCDIFNRGLI